MVEISHTPVMVEEVMSSLRCHPGGVYIDATLGEGGHAREILSRTKPDGMLVGIEWDEEAVRIAKEHLKDFHERVIVVQDNFKNIRPVLQRLSIPKVDGILLDLGISSFQLEHTQRGFSFSREGPLDMRIDRRNPITALELLRTSSQEELETLLVKVGQGRWARRIARALKERVEESEAPTTVEIARLISKVIPARYHPRKIHPATKTFLALRIAVNHEIKNLEDFFPESIECLKPGGRLCIISFHSLEDRAVKQTFRVYERGCICPPRISPCRCGKVPQIKILTAKALCPSPEEVQSNPRARSARLRVAERLA